MQHHLESGKGRSILDEIFQEAFIPCTNPNCQCAACRFWRDSNNKSSLQQIRELGFELTLEEEYELSKAFDKIKALAKRTYHRAKPLIVAADIVRRSFFPSFEPVPQMKDVAAYIEQDKRRQTQSRVESAQQGTKRDFKQKPPDGEMSLIQEIFMETENQFNRPTGFLHETEHKKGARPSTIGKHEKGQTRKIRDRGGEKGDERRDLPRKKPNNWKGPWPPR